MLQVPALYVLLLLLLFAVAAVVLHPAVAVAVAASFMAVDGGGWRSLVFLLLCREGSGRLDEKTQHSTSLSTSDLSRYGIYQPLFLVFLFLLLVLLLLLLMIRMLLLLLLETISSSKAKGLLLSLCFPSLL